MENEKTCPPLWLACKNGFYDVVCRELVEEFVDINQMGGRYHTTPLMVAALHYRVAIVELLLNSKADMNVRDDRGLKASHLATAAGHLPLLSSFAMHGDDLDASPSGSVLTCKRGRLAPFYEGLHSMDDIYVCE